MQHNVTLGKQSILTDKLRGKPFPCPLCGMALPVEISQKQKPYCTCNVCGIQIFIRGKTGINRLVAILETLEPLPTETPLPSTAVALYNRLSKLKSKRAALEQEQGIIFRDRDLDNALAAMDTEIRCAQEDLERTRKALEKKR